LGTTFAFGIDRCWVYTGYSYRDFLHNTYLQKSEKLYENKILGPESIVVDGGKYR
jgi:hypothetical protein